MQKYLPELLTEINDDPKLLEKLKGDSALTLLFQFAFEPEKKFLLPEGDPPFKPDAAPIGMSMGILRQELKRFYVFCRQDLPAVRREDLFIQLLEGVHPSEAELLLSIKDQNLSKKYKKITHELVYNLGFVKSPPPEKKVKEPKTKKSTGVAE
jgi:hypothetical protein